MAIFIFILSNLFWIGLLIIILTLLLSRPYLTIPRYKASNAKKINKAYASGFFVMIYDGSIMSMDYGLQQSWIEYAGYALIALLGIGALLENRRDFPLLRKELLDALNQMKQDKPDDYFRFLVAVELYGMQDALEEFGL